MFRTGSPWLPVHRLRDEMERLFSAAAGDGWDSFRPQGQPNLNAWDSPEAIHVELEVPGLRPDQLDLSVVGDELTVRIERSDVQREGAVYHRRERPVGSFSRVLQLPCEVDADRVEANLQNGVLEITLPKAASAQPRKIQVCAK